MLDNPAGLGKRGIMCGSQGGKEVRVMVRRTPRLGAAGRAALATAAVGAIITVAACGSRAAANQPASAGGAGAASMPGGRTVTGVALCRHIPQLTRVVVSRTTPLHELEPAIVLLQL